MSAVIRENLRKIDMVKFQILRVTKHDRIVTVF